MEENPVNSVGFLASKVVWTLRRLISHSTRRAVLNDTTYSDILGVSRQKNSIHWPFTPTPWIFWSFFSLREGDIHPWPPQALLMGPWRGRGGRFPWNLPARYATDSSASISYPVHCGSVARFFSLRARVGSVLWVLKLLISAVNQNLIVSK